MDFQCRGTPDGNVDFGVYGREKLRTFLKAHPGIRLKLSAELPESGRLRRYWEGALVPLICFYQEGMDHRDSDDRRKVREWLKLEFNSYLVVVNGQVHRVAKSTSGRAVLNPFVERVVDWLTENYAPPVEALDPEKYRVWRDTVYPFGGPDNYIGYLIEIGLLKLPQ